MQLDIKKDGRNLFVKVMDPLNVTTSVEFLDRVKPEINILGKIEIDISEMEYTSSAGLRAFLTIENMMESDDGMVIKAPNEVVRGVFKESGLDRVFTIID